MKAAVVIPARLGSQRFPRKVLARDTGKYLIQHVYEGVLGCPGVDRIILATDSEEVAEACRSFGAEVALTSPTHVSGTDRVAEVARGLSDDVIINVQGDEPLIEHGDLRTILGLFEAETGTTTEHRGTPDVVMATLVVPRADPEGFLDPNIVKAVVAQDGHALYFSRSPVPYAAIAGSSAAGGSRAWQVEWFQHVGIYAYRREFLLELTALPPTPLEKREKLEQLRALEHGYRIKAGRAERPHVGIDTREEYEEFVKAYLGKSQRAVGGGQVLE